MNPSQNPLDYLNQIAPTKPTTSFVHRLRPIHFIAGSIIVLLLLGIIMGSITNALNANKVRMEHLAARLQTLQTITQSATQYIKDGQLTVLNSNLNIYLTNINNDIISPFSQVGVNAAHPPKAIVVSESGKALSGRLVDAHLNAVYDTTYAREMAYQLSITLTLMKEIYQSTHNGNVKSVLEKAYNNLSPTQSALDSFTTTTE